MTSGRLSAHPLPSRVTSLSRTSKTKRQPSAAAATSMPSSWLSCSRVMQPAAQRRSCCSPASQRRSCCSPASQCDAQQT